MNFVSIINGAIEVGSILSGHGRHRHHHRSVGGQGAGVGHHHRRTTSGGGGCCGMLFIVLSAALLFWNEGRAVKQYAILQDGIQSVVEIDNPALPVDPSKEGKLVHLVGEAKGTTMTNTSDNSGKLLLDDVFGVQAKSQDTLKLVRDVVMFQWQETAYQHEVTKNDGTTKTEVSYTYSKGWFSSAVDSNKFHTPGGHENPNSMPYKSQGYVAEKVTIGGDYYEASSTMIQDKMSWYTPKLDGISIDNIPDDELKTKIKALSSASGFYLGDDPYNPQLGDAKITYRVVLPSIVTVLAQQSGSSFVPYQGKKKKNDGYDIFFVLKGSYTAEAIFEEQLASNAFITKVFRFVGVLLMYLGIGGMLQPLSALFRSIPLVGACLGDTIFPFIQAVFAAMFSGIVIAVAWLRFHPLQGIAFIAVVVGISYMVWKKAKNQHQLLDDGDEEEVSEASSMGICKDDAGPDEETPEAEMVVQ